MRGAGQRRENGFTLLEVLVAVVVLGLLTAGLAQGLRFGFLAWGRQSAIVDQLADLDAVDRVLRHVIEQIDPGNAHDAPIVRGTPDSLEFTSELPIALSSRRAEMRLMLDGEHRLVLRWSPYTHALRFGPPPEPTTTVLLAGVTRLEFSYWPSPDTSGTGWRSEWHESELPALIRLRLEFPTGRDRHWPIIVVAPRRRKF